MPPFHFIIVSFFAISAFFANSYQSFLVFIGAFIGVVVTTFIEKIEIVNTLVVNGIDTNGFHKCYGLPIIGDTVYKLPQSIFIYAYLAVYFISVFSANSLWKSFNNVFLVMFLSGMFMYEAYRIYKVCFPGNLLIIGIPAIIGIMWGMLWPTIITKKNHYKPGMSSSDKCQLNPDGSTNIKYQCKLQTDGTLI